MEFPFDIQTIEIFKSLFSIYGTITPQGKVLSLAGSIFDNTFADPKLLVGHDLTETVFWQSSEANYRVITDAVEAASKGIVSKSILEFRISKEEKSFIELNLHPVYEDDNRKIKHIFLCGQDVTAREKEIEFYKRRGEQLLYAAESAEIGLWFWDLNEDKIYSTPKCNGFFEISPFETLTYNDFLEVVHPDDRQNLIDTFVESQKNGTEYDVEYRVIYSDANIHWLSTRGKTYLDAEGNPASMMGVVRLITDRKNADEELSRVYARERKARDEAEEANRTKDYFLALVSHELRSPLNAILGWTKILLTKDVNDETRRNALQTIERSAMSQAKLIGDLVDSSRIASGKLRLEMRPMNIFDAVQTVYNSQKPTAEARKINLTFEYNTEEASVFGDLVRLQQVFTNLLTNALKFTPEGGNIHLNLSAGDGKVVISLKDDGQGINPETLPHIFRQFSQGDQTISRDQAGLGLGLSIVKTLVEKHEGAVTAYSEGTGRGATFTVTLPLVKPVKSLSPDDKARQNYEAMPLSKIKILCVEDDLDSREVLQLFLEQCGASVVSVESAAEAVTVMGKNGRVFDVIISDLAMPNEDGYSLISQIRQFSSDNGGKTPAVALSAFTTRENKEKAFAVGFQKYHTKPFEPDLLVRDILDLVKNSKAN
ncbi:MAG TPA: ATP-binding protein [Pyrinomonadaceae bacterium]|jgi:signal transduction histidine kinase/ActR/RegA family two-component response regulator